MCDKLHWFTGVVIKGPFVTLSRIGNCQWCHAHTSKAFVTKTDFDKMSDAQTEPAEISFDDVADTEIQYYCVECWFLNE